MGFINLLLIGQILQPWYKYYIIHWCIPCHVQASAIHIPLVCSTWDSAQDTAVGNKNRVQALNRKVGIK